jgi:hypothetical protein
MKFLPSTKNNNIDTLLLSRVEAHPALHFNQGIDISFHHPYHWISEDCSRHGLDSRGSSSSSSLGGGRELCGALSFSYFVVLLGSSSLEVFFAGNRFLAPFSKLLFGALGKPRLCARSFRSGHWSLELRFSDRLFRSWHL